MRFSKDELFSNEVVPEGTYSARVTAARERHSQAGNPMVVVSLRVPSGHEVLDYFVTAGIPATALAIARRRLLALCDACRVTITPDEELDLSLLIGAVIEIDVTISAGKRGRRNTVTRYRPAPDEASS